jgi:hypothetical protein
MAAYRGVADRVYRTDRDGAVSVLGYADGRFEVVLGKAALRERARAADLPPATGGRAEALR